MVCVRPFRVILVFLALAALAPAWAEKAYTAEEACAQLGAILRWDPFFAAGTLTVKEHRLAFYSGEAGEAGPALMDGRELLKVNLPYRSESGSLYFPESFITPVRRAFNKYIEEDRTHFRIAAIIVDPGHGGKDVGAIGSHVIDGKPLKSVEKDITLAVGRGLADRLRRAYPGKQVLMTRTGDTFPSLEDRVNIANSVPLRDNEAIIYVSVHANASLNKNARGYEVWYLTPEYRRELIDKNKYSDSAEVIPILNAMLEEEFTTESTRMARFITSRFEEALGGAMPSRGLKAENWYVVRNARMPSVLVELGFVTNPQDAVLMADPAHLNKLSEALFKGVADFVTEFETSGGYIK